MPKQEPVSATRSRTADLLGGELGESIPQLSAAGFSKAGRRLTLLDEVGAARVSGV